MDSTHKEEALFHALAEVIRARKTVKVFGSVENPPPISAQALAFGDDFVRRGIAAAGLAPFHFSRQLEGIAEPWRVYWLPAAGCRRLSREIVSWFDDVKPGNKMPSLLAACGAVILVAWIPQRAESENEAEKIAGVNEEHLAATAAYVQNLLLLLEAGGLRTYWSSGGLLKTPQAFERLGIPADRQLLACIFVDYAKDDATRPIEIAGGGQRAKRSPSERWTTEIDWR
jgi:nitroreductase